METILADKEAALRRATTWTIVVAIAAILCGALAIAMPFWGAVAATFTFGAVALAAGAFELGYAWRTRHDAGALWRFVIGAAYLIAGIWVLAQPGVGMVTLALALGVMLLARGISVLMLAYELRSTHVWGWYALDAVISLALGAFVLNAWPARSILYLGLFFGAGLVVNGWQRFMVALWLRHVLPPTTRTPPLTAARA